MLATEPVGRVLARLSVPATMGLLAGAANNLIDAFFLGRFVGVDAIAGITIVFPFLLIVMAMAQGIGIGGAVLLSICLGRQETEKAEQYLGTVLALSLLAGIVVLAAGYVFMEPLLGIMGASSRILPYSREYLSWILPAYALVLLAQTGASVVRSEGHAKEAMLTVLIGAGLNIALDPLFIVGLGLGVRGAALAATISFGASVAYLGWYFQSGTSNWRVRLSNITLHLKRVRAILHMGVSAFARQVAGGVMTLVINNSIARYGTDSTLAAFGIMNRLLAFLMMPLYGLSHGLQPLLGFTVGGGNGSRAVEAVRLSWKTATIFSVSTFLLLFAFAPQLVTLFNASPTLLAEGRECIRLASLGLSFVGFQIVATVVFLAVGKGMTSLALTLTRQLLIFIPLAIILPLFWGTRGIWLSFPASDVLSFLLAWMLVRKEMHRLRGLRPGQSLA